MQLFLYKDTKDETIHASVNGKKTGCRINLTKNASQFSQSGTRDFTDLIDFLDAVNCKNCQDAFSKKVLAADNKARREKTKAAQKQARSGYSPDEQNLVNLAEEQERKQAHTSRPAPPPDPHPNLPPPPSAAPNLPPPPAAEQPAPPPPAPVAPELDDNALPKYEEWVPPTKKKEQAPAVPATGIDDSLAAFMVNKTEDPTAAAFASDNSKNPNVLAEQQEAPYTAAEQNPLLDDTLAQFNLNPAAKPAPAQPEPEEDIMAQFSLKPEQTAPAKPAPSAPQPVSGLMDDTLAQFSLNPEQAPVAPQNTEPQSVDELLKEFGQTPEDSESQTLDELFAKFKEKPAPKPQPAPAPQPAVSDFGNLEVPQLNAPSKPVSAEIPEVPQLAPPKPVPSFEEIKQETTAKARASSAIMDDATALDGVGMAPKVENREEEEDDYMALVVNTRLEDYDDDDDDDDYDDDDYYDDDDEEEYHGSSYAPHNDDDEEEDYEPAPPAPAQKPAPAVAAAVVNETPQNAGQTAADITAAAAAITAAAAAITAATAAAKPAVSSISGLGDLPDLSSLTGLSDLPDLDIPSVPDVPDIPSVPDVPDVPGVADMDSNPFEAEADVDIPEVPTLAVPTISDSDLDPMIPVTPTPNYLYGQKASQARQSMYIPPSPPQSVYLNGGQPQYPQYAQPQQPQSMYFNPPQQPQSVYLGQPPQYQQSMPAPAVHTPTNPYNGGAMNSLNSVQIQQMQRQQMQPQIPATQGVRVSTIEQKTVVPDAVRNAIANTAARAQENIFDQQGNKVEIANDIMSALNQMGEDTSNFTKKKQETNEPEIKGVKEWKPKENKKRSDFMKNLHKKGL